MTWIKQTAADLCGGSSHSRSPALSAESPDTAQVPGMLEVSGAGV
jgi:hypothetical protein